MQNTSNVALGAVIDRLTFLFLLFGIFYSPCGVVVLPEVELTVIDGVEEFREKWAASWAFPVSFESCRDSENLREFKPKLATPLVTFATSELKKLILCMHL